MNMFEELSLENPGVLWGRIPDNTFTDVKAAIDPAVEAAVPYNDSLVGNIEMEYKFPLPPSFIEYINSMWCAYRDRFSVWRDQEYNVPDYAWINLMKKGEYNPLHVHDGVVSWVAWLDIPYNLEDEIATMSTMRQQYATASMFQFVYNKLDGVLSHMNLPIDENWVGSMVMFPAYLRHQVYPFATSDGYRISISSNIKLV